MYIKPDSIWWLDSAHYLCKCDPLSGLRKSQANDLLNLHGLNTLRANQSRSLTIQFLSKFKNPLVLVLLIASVVSAFTGEVTNFAIISVIVLMSVLLDFIQEFRANQAADKLRQSVSVRTKVIRDGVEIDLSVQEVVPGDIALVCAGDLIPADSLVVDAKDFLVNQSLLTGEAFPVAKNSAPLPSTATQLQDADNAVFMGTSVVGGSARILVIKTGMNTAIGDIAQSLDKPTQATSFELGARRFGMMIMSLTIILVLFVLFVNAWFHKPWLESFLFAVALAVGLTPELLPMVVSITLSRGALRLSKLKMIVKRQSAIQDLGSMDVFCTDKTGTLTQAKIKLEVSCNTLGQINQDAWHYAYLNSYFQSGLKNPMEEAILASSHIDPNTWIKIDEIPFDFDRRCVSVLIDDGSKRLLVVKGAADDVVKSCRYSCSTATAETCEMTLSTKAEVRNLYHSFEADGLRVLGVAYKEMDRSCSVVSIQDEVDLTLVGFVTFLDPPKESSSAALIQLQSVGVGIKVVTGDSELVTQHVCRKLGIEVTGVLLGKEIASLDDSALRSRVDEVNLFCRVNPAQKLRVIMALKSNGHVVGYMGDGINDAPSLHVADVGISVDTAVDVAKAAADIILLEQDLTAVHAGVLEGRRTFGNIMKYIMMGTSSNFGNMFSMAGASLFLPFLPMLPTQILLNNILYDISEIPIPLDEVDDCETITPKVLDLNFIRYFMLVIGPISSVFDFLTFYLLLSVFEADEKLFQTGWFVESLCTQVLVIFIIRTRGSPFRSRPHPILTMTSLLVVLLAVCLPLMPIGQYFGFVAPTLHFYEMLLALVLLYLTMVQVVKHFFYRWVESRAHVRQKLKGNMFA